MTYAFLIVVSVAITMKLLFLSFSLYFTLKNTKALKTKEDADPTKQKTKSFMVSWKKIPHLFLPKNFYCPEVNSTAYTNK